jgi:acyl carrier protein
MEAAVTARTDQFGQKGLVAYFTSEAAHNGSIEDLRKELAAWLPSYMLPDVFVKMDRLPRLASGKIDLQSLPEAGQKNVTPKVAHRAAPTPLEQTIITIVEQLLNTTGLGPDSNFFRLGGNSLLTLRFIATLDATFGTSLSPMDFLALPTIAEIASLIEPSIKPEKKTGEVAIALGGANCCAREPIRNSLEEVSP